MAIFFIDDISERTKERFWAKVDRNAERDCWPWLAYRSARGYGYFGLSTKRIVKATHVALTLSGAPRPSERHGALHRCDNPPCCNPAHLFWGTQAENTKDAYDKGRKKPMRGTIAKRSKLTEADVLAIRASPEGVAALGRRYGIGPAHVGNIRKRRIWRHI